MCVVVKESEDAFSVAGARASTETFELTAINMHGSKWSGKKKEWS